MAAQGLRRREYEDRDSGSRAPLLVLAAIAIFGLAVLMLYIAVVEPQQGTAMGAIRDVMRGLGGHLSPVLALMVAWAGVLCIFAVRGRRMPVYKIILDTVMVAAIFAAVHMFLIESIYAKYEHMLGMADFVSKSYRSGIGGGAIGALIAWPLYRYLGVAGGFIACLLIVLLCLTATGRMKRIVDWFSDRAEDRRARAESRPRRDNIEREFENDLSDRQPQRRRPARDPFSESVLGSSGGSAAPARQRSRSAQPARRGDSARTARPAREAVAAGPAARKRASTRQEEAIVAEKPAKAAAKPIKRKKLYIENVPPEGDGFDEFGSVDEAKLSKSQIEDMGFDSDDFDDFDRLDAESILKDREETERKKGFKPDRAASVERARREKKAAVDEPDVAVPAAPIVKADKHTNVSIDDLKIEPEDYEQPDEDDDAPFDLPAKKGSKKEPLPKIKRGEMKVELEDDAPEYNYPPIDLLAQGEAEDVSKHARKDREKAQLLEETLQSFGISARLTGIAHGPAVTRFELQPAPGIKVSRITSLADDIALNLAAMSVRIEAPIPGKAAVGVEIPNEKVEMVRLRDVLESSDARKHPSKIAVGLGKDNSGRYIVADIAKMPHVLIAGQTGSGKSVCINAIIASILFRASPEEVRLILIDPKVVELSIYNDIPHLVCPVVTDPKKAASALDWAVAEMTKRYKLFAERGVRDIKGYNKSLKEGEKLMPQMVIIIDELADLMMVSPGEVEDSICRLAQLARACGMHLVIATQRPSVNVITGIIKANIPTRIAFSVASQVDSRTMIDHGGAEKLLGNGDMLFVPNGMKSMRVQGAWVSDEEVHAIVSYIKQSGEAVYDPDMLEHLENAVKSDAEKEEFEAEYDAKLPEAVSIAVELGQVSISMLQRKMRIGYARAGRIIDEMSRRGIVSEADGSKPREVLISREQAEAMFDEE